MRGPPQKNSCLQKAPLNNLQTEAYVEAVSDIILPCSRLFLGWLSESGTVPALLFIMKDWNACVPASLANWSSSDGRSQEETGLEGRKTQRVSSRCSALHCASGGGHPASGDRPWLPALVGPLLPAILPALETKSAFLPLLLSGLSHQLPFPLLFWCYLILPNSPFPCLKDLLRILLFREDLDGYCRLGVISLGLWCLDFWSCGLWGGLKKEKTHLHQFGLYSLQAIYAVLNLHWKNVIEV